MTITTPDTTSNNVNPLCELRSVEFVESFRWVDTTTHALRYRLAHSLTVTHLSLCLIVGSITQGDVDEFLITLSTALKHGDTTLDDIALAGLAVILDLSKSQLTWTAEYLTSIANTAPSVMPMASKMATLCLLEPNVKALLSREKH